MLTFTIYLLIDSYIEIGSDVLKFLTSTIQSSSLKILNIILTLLYCHQKKYVIYFDYFHLVKEVLRIILFHYYYSKMDNHLKLPMYDIITTYPIGLHKFL